MLKFGRIIFYAIIVLLVITFVSKVIRDDFAGSAMGIWFALTLVVGALVSIVVSSVMYLINNPKSSKSLLIGTGVIAIICIIAYSASSGVIDESYEKYNITQVSQSKLIDMGLYLTFTLGVTAIVSIIVSEAVALFKN
jgi:hypothetical protein